MSFIFGAYSVKGLCVKDEKRLNVEWTFVFLPNVYGKRVHFIYKKYQYLFTEHVFNWLRYRSKDSKLKREKCKQLEISSNDTNAMEIEKVSHYNGVQR